MVIRPRPTLGIAELPNFEHVITLCIPIYNIYVYTFFLCIDSWLVELRVPRVTSYCKGVLISNTKILATRDCKWLTTSALGGIFVTFPSIKGQPQIETKSNFSEIVVLPQSNASALTSKQIGDLYGLMVFELEAAPDSNFTPLCLPTTPTTTQCAKLS